MQMLVILNRTTRADIGDRIECADTSLTRLVGLLGRRGLEAGGGIWIRPSSGVHTFGMRFAIDVVGLDQGMRVVKLWPRIKPHRMTSINPKVRSVLELVAGQIEARAIRVGDTLDVKPVPNS